MQLFHASCRLYAQGDRVSANERSMTEKREEIERRLELYAPPGVRSRLNAVFAADNAAFAAFYLSLEADIWRDKHLYRVQVRSGSRHPMALVDVAGLARDDASCSAIAKEYWRPTRDWRCWEYICVELVVLDEEPWPEQLMVSGASYAYGIDRDEAKRLLQ